MIRMPWWRMFRARGRHEPAPTEAQARDERLGAYIDGDWDATETPALQSALTGDPELRSAMEGMREVRDALAALGEVRAPRPFALAEPPAPVASRLELATRFGAAMTAVLLTVAIIGDVTARAELAAAPAAADESAGSAAAAAPAVPTMAALAAAPTVADELTEPAPAAAPATVEGTSGEEAAPARAPAGQTPAAAPDPQVTADGAAATGAESDAVEALELGLGAATVTLALLAAAQWHRRRRSR